MGEDTGILLGMYEYVYGLLLEPLRGEQTS